AWGAVAGGCGGNGLALRIVGETIRRVFGGEIPAFLHEGGPFFGGIRRLLEAQLDRSSPLEQAVLRRLAVAREPVTFTQLAADLGPGIARGAALEAVEALRRRAVGVPRERGATFTLPPVGLDFLP